MSDYVDVRLITYTGDEPTTFKVDVRVNGKLVRAGTKIKLRHDDVIEGLRNGPIL